MKKRISVIALVTAVLVSGSCTTAFAKDSYSGKSANMDIVTFKTPQKKEDACIKWAKKYVNDWTESVTPPIIADGYMYTAKDNVVLKIDTETGELVKMSEELSGSTAYSVIPLTYGGGMIFVPVGEGKIQALDAENLKSLWISDGGEIKGQTISPICYKDGYIFTGTWNGEDKTGEYFCIDVKDEDEEKTDEVKKRLWSIEHTGGFYYAGAFVTDDFLVFGSDDGEDGSETESSVLYSVNILTGEVIDKIEGLYGDIRSKISYDKDTKCIYFTSKGGKLYKVELHSDGSFKDKKELDLSGSSTSTPVVCDGLVYVGVSGPAPFDSEGHSVIIADADTMETVKTISVPGCPQADGILSRAYDGVVYYYTTYNCEPGGIYGIAVTRNSETVNAEGFDVFVPDEDMKQYCVCKISYDGEGTLYYKNDSGYIMAVRLASGECKIRSVKINNYIGSIDEENKTITFKLPAKTDISTVKPTIEVSKGAALSPKSGEAVDFTNGAVYTVTAENGDSAEYTVSIELEKEKSGTKSGGNDKKKKTQVPVKENDKKEETTLPYGIEKKFTDINDHWAKNFIEKLVRKNVLSGRTEETFAPDDYITRAEFVAVLYRLSGKTGNAYAGFSDVKREDWFYDAVMWAAGNGIVSGAGEDTFLPDERITREQLAAILERYLEKMGYSIADQKDKTVFSDDENISEWAKESVYKMQKKGVISGMGDNKFLPKGNATRAEAAAMLSAVIGD